MGRLFLQAFVGLFGSKSLLVHTLINSKQLLIQNDKFMPEYTLQLCDQCLNGKESQTMEGWWHDTLLVCFVAHPCERKNLPAIYTFLEISKPTSPRPSTSNKLDFLISVPVQPARPPIIGFILFCSSTSIGQFQTEPV